MALLNLFLLKLHTDKIFGSDLLLIIHDIAAIFLISFLVILNCGRRIELEIRLHDQPDRTNLVICTFLVVRVLFTARQKRRLFSALVGLIDRAEMSIDSSALSVRLLSCLANSLNMLSAWA